MLYLWGKEALELIFSFQLLSTWIILHITHSTIFTTIINQRQRVAILQENTSSKVLEKIQTKWKLIILEFPTDAEISPLDKALRFSIPHKRHNYEDYSKTLELYYRSIQKSDVWLNKNLKHVQI